MKIIIYNNFSTVKNAKLSKTAEAAESFILDMANIWFGN
jgi:hypothetical protein